MICKIFKIIVFYFINFSLFFMLIRIYIYYIRQLLHHYDHYNKQCDYLRDTHSLFIE